MLRMKNRISSIKDALQPWFGGIEFYEARLPLNPVPASRPRVTRWGVYYGKIYKAYRAALAEHVAKAKRSFNGSPVAGCLEFVVQRPKTTERQWPRGDGDNFEKAILDGITAHADLWKDDDQLVMLFWAKRYVEEDEEPHTHIIFWRMRDG